MNRYNDAVHGAGDTDISTKQIRRSKRISKNNSEKRGRSRQRKILKKVDHIKNVNKNSVISDYNNESTEHKRRSKRISKENSIKKIWERPIKTLKKDDHIKNEIENSVLDSENKDKESDYNNESTKQKKSPKKTFKANIGTKKGRGRPSKTLKEDDSDENEVENAVSDSENKDSADSDDNDESTKQKKSPKKTSKENIGMKKGRGRPKKSLKEDDSDENEVENAVSDSENEDSADSDDNDESTKQKKSPKKTTKGNIGIRKGRGRLSKILNKGLYNENETESTFSVSENKNSVFSVDKDSDYSNESTKQKKSPKRGSEENIGIKRGRGRPKKIPNIHSENEGSEVSEDNNETNKQKNVPKRKYEESIGIKRGRGRPRKTLKEDNHNENDIQNAVSDSEYKVSAISDDKDSDYSNESTEQKKSPKKTSKENMGTKKGRGRPSKILKKNDHNENGTETVTTLSDSENEDSDYSNESTKQKKSPKKTSKENMGTKKGRGRPSKILKKHDHNENGTESTLSDSENEDSDYSSESTKQKKSPKKPSKENMGTKKGRGRPSKILIKHDHNENGTESTLSDSENEESAVRVDKNSDSSNEYDRLKRREILKKMLNIKENIGIRKGRGRQSKILTKDVYNESRSGSTFSVSENKGSIVTDDNSDTTIEKKILKRRSEENIGIKRGRGRPKKIPKIDSGDDNYEKNIPKSKYEENIGIKRGRGRPRKIVKTEVSIKTEEGLSSSFDSKNRGSIYSEDNYDDKRNDFNNGKTKQKRRSGKNSEESIHINGNKIEVESRKRRATRNNLKIN